MSRPAAAAKVSLTAELKALIGKPEALGAPPPAPPFAATAAVLSSIRSQAATIGVSAEYETGPQPWLILSTAAVCAIASPATLCQLYDFATEGSDTADCAAVASTMRETGLKCISYSGAPTAINNLNALRAHLPDEVVALLPTDARRQPSAEADARGRELYASDGVFAPHESGLAASHPDLPAYVVNHYASLVADPAEGFGRGLSAMIALAAVRATGGSGEELLPFVEALCRFSDGRLAPLGSDDGVEWIISSVDSIARLFDVMDEA